MTELVRLAVVGAGSRGMTYAREAVNNHGAVVTAIAEPRPRRLASAAAELGVPPDRAVADWTDLAELSTLDVDAVVVATPDIVHTEPALAFIGRGLPVLLEKPMAPTEQDAVRIAAAAAERGVLVCVAHVLRYSRYTQVLKGLLAEGRIGEVVSIEHLEPVGWWHQAHSFVRGNWRREDQSSSMLMSKCCHDVDWLSYLVDRDAVRVSSFGSLTHFTAANRPAGAADRCLDCSVEPDCPYSARRIYLDRVDDPAARAWPLSVVTDDVTPAGVEEALRTGPYGRCVYACDNDVVDHQVVDIEYAGGVTASLTMTAFTPMEFRRTRVFGTRGSIEGDGATITVFDFLTATSQTIAVLDPDDPEAFEGHLGADAALTRDFVEAVRHGDASRILTSPAESLHTHQIVWAAERARRHRRVEELAPPAPEQVSPTAR